MLYKTLILGKTKILKQLASANFRELARCFGDISMTQDKIGDLGIQLMVKR